jgi:hypothetical protein
MDLFSHLPKIFVYDPLYYEVWVWTSDRGFGIAREALKRIPKNDRDSYVNVYHV